MKDAPDYVPALRIPQNCPNWPRSWDTVRNDDDLNEGYEQDADSPAIDVLTQLRDASMTEGGIQPEDLQRLEALTLRMPVSISYSVCTTKKLFQFVEAVSRLSTQRRKAVVGFFLMRCNAPLNNIALVLILERSMRSS